MTNSHTEEACRHGGTMDFWEMKMIREKEIVSNFLSAAGYAAEEINKGLDYADSIGWSTADQLGQLALSKILLTESQLSDGELVGWSPVDWPKDDN